MVLKWILVGLVTLLMLASARGQDGIEVRVQAEREKRGEAECFTVDVRQVNGETLKLASMNYRLFYNSDKLKLVEDGVRLKLPDHHYTLKLVQNLREVDASGTGPLPFEGNLGFLNYSVIFQDGSQGSISLDKAGPWLPISQLCFNVLKDDGLQTIVLARDEVTARYGKAFVELSAYNQNDEIIAAKISAYKDLNFQLPDRTN